MFRQEPDTVALDQRCRLDPCFVICQSFLRCQSCHADVHAGFFRVRRWILRPYFSKPADHRIQQNDVNVVVLIWWLTGAQLFQGPTLQSGPTLTKTANNVVGILSTASSPDPGNLNHVPDCASGEGLRKLSFVPIKTLRLNQADIAVNHSELP